VRRFANTQEDLVRIIVSCFSYHMHDSELQKTLHEAVHMAHIPERVTCHTMRHYASHLLRASYDMRTIQQLLGHSDIRHRLAPRSMSPCWKTAFQDT